VIVFIHDDVDHHIASLVRNGEGPPLLWIRGPLGPTPAGALDGAGIVPVMTVLDDEDGWTVRTFGDARDCLDVTCRECSPSVTLCVRAADMRTKRTTRSARHTPTMRVSVTAQVQS
jgi:hypothetical protein